MENESLPGILSSIDTLLCLHFASSTTIPTLFEICTKATHLTKRRVDQSVVEQIVGYDPTLYNVVYTGTSCNDYGLSIPSGVSLAKFGASIPHRKTRLEEKVRDTSTSYPPAKLASLVRLQKRFSWNRRPNSTATVCLYRPLPVKIEEASEVHLCRQLNDWQVI